VEHGGGHSLSLGIVDHTYQDAVVHALQRLLHPYLFDSVVVAVVGKADELPWGHLPIVEHAVVV